MNGRLAHSRWLPYLAVGISILALGSSAIFVRWAAAPPAVMGFYRIGGAALILTPFALLRRKRPQAVPPAPLARGALFFPLLGGVASAIDHFLWNTSLEFTSAANATLLGNTAPLWVALTAWLLFREKLTGRFWLGLSLTMTGAAAVLGNDFLRHPNLGWGDLLALSASLFYAAYYLITQRGRRFFDTLTYVWLLNVSCGLALLLMCLITRSPLTGYPPQTYWAFLGAALIPQVSGYLAMGYALGKLPASVVAPTMVGQPVVTALLAIPLLGEPLHPVQVVGGLVVLAGIFGVNRSRRAA